MKVPQLLAAAIASVAVLFAVVVQAAPMVAYGNLGSDGAKALSDTTTDYGPTLTTKRLAQGFTTGTSTDFLAVQSVTLGLFNDAVPAARTVGIYSDNGGVPGTLLQTSLSVAVTTAGKYTFEFPSYQLSAGSSYWIVPEAPASWYRDLDESQPQGENGSGWTWLATKRETVSGWSTNANSLSISVVTVQAVPEPSTYAMAGIGLASAGLMHWRRRRAQA